MAKEVFQTTKNYQKGNFPFPDDDINPKLKNEEWALKWCQAMWAKHVSGNTAVPYSKYDEFIELRRYAEGNQDIAKYQNILLDQSENEGEMEGYMNIDNEILSVMPKFLHIIRGIFEEQEHKAVASAVDPFSVDEKQKAKLRLWFKSQNKDLLDTVNKMAGVEPEKEWIPENVDEINLYESAGGLKLSKETNIEEALKYTFYISDWKEIKRKQLDDFATINCSCVRDYTDRYTQKAKIRYVDPANLIMQYSKHWDHRNSTYAGERVKESIANIRKVTGIPEDQLKKIAQGYNGRNGNTNITSWDDDLLYANDGCEYDEFNVDIVDAEWRSVNSEYRTKRTNERGDTFEYDEKWGKEYKTEKKKTNIKLHECIYRCKWIVGTETAYDFGHQYDVVRPGKKQVELSYKFYKLPGRSIVSLARTHLDQMQLTWLKLQNAIAMAAPSGIAVEYTSLMNMKLGGNKLEPLEILSIRRGTGDYVYKTTTHMGKPNLSGGMRPIQELEGGIGRQLEEYLRLFDMNLNFIRDLTGINKVADASAPDPNQSVGGSEIAIAATNNALKPIYSGYIRTKEQVARSSTIRVQMLLRYNKGSYEGYIPVIGGAGAQILRVGAEVVDVDYDIMIQAKPTQQRKQVILQAATNALKQDQDGNAGIEYKDFLMIERLLEEGNEKLAEMMLNYTTHQRKQERLRIQRENMQIDAKNAQETDTVKTQNAIKAAQAALERDIALEQKKSEFENYNDEQKHLRKMDEIRLEKSLENENNNENNNEQKSA